MAEKEGIKIGLIRPITPGLSEKEFLKYARFQSSS
jgi:hypothetical protein